MKTIIILFSLFVFITSCDNSNDKKRFFADSLIEISNEELAIHQNRGKSMLTLEDRKKKYENKIEIIKWLENVSKEYGANNPEIIKEIGGYPGCDEILLKNVKLMNKFESERELDDYYIKEILNKNLHDFKQMSACESLETMCHLANYQLSLYEKYGDLSEGGHKERLNKILKLSLIVSEITKKNHSEAELKKCAFYDTFIFISNSIGKFKKDM
jgi:hypothetical protein